jgi:hypothetical protein
LRIFTREAARAIRAEVNDDLTPEVLDFPTIDGGLEGMAFITMAVQSAKAGGVLPKCPLQVLLLLKSPAVQQLMNTSYPQ